MKLVDLDDDRDLDWTETNIVLGTLFTIDDDTNKKQD